MRRAHRLLGLGPLGLLLTLLLALLPAGRARAGERVDPRDVPEPLKAWVHWALDGKEEARCPGVFGKADTTRCAWPARLDLVLDEHGGRFTQTWRLEETGYPDIPLPGDEHRWPASVTVDGVRAVVIGGGGTPRVALRPGSHEIRGAFLWDSLPESLAIPAETGIVTLTVRGEAVAWPNRDAKGTLWLQKAATVEEGDSIDLTVHRKVIDDIPLRLETQIELRVAGKNREELLGKVLPPAFVTHSVDAPLPARVEPDGRLRVQVRPGTFVVTVVARSEGPVASLARPAPQGTWAPGEEVWVFQAKPDFRVVSVEGVATIDPQQTTLPPGWRDLPAYPMKVGSTLTFTERRRGDADPPPDQLTLGRELWLDGDGHGYSVSDSIKGEVHAARRLSMDAPTVLGRVAADEADQFITHLPGGSAGIEVRKGWVRVDADSRINGDISDIPAVGWANEFTRVAAKLHLPPGWRLLHVAGADDVPFTWLHQWTLLQVFLVLVVAIGVGRLHGARWGVVALATLVLILPETGAPRWSWPVIVALDALARMVPAGTWKRLCVGARGVAVVGVAIAALPFLVRQAREGMYPVTLAPTVTVGHHEGDNQVMYELVGDAMFEAAEATADNKEGGTGTRAKGEEGSMGNPTTKEPGHRGYPAPPRPTEEVAKAETRGFVYDPTVMVQTGPGIPEWRWLTFDLTWSGPVGPHDRLKLYLASPAVNLVAALARDVLMLLLLLRLMPWTEGVLRRRGSPAAAAAAAVLLLLLTPRVARADIPDKATLDELTTRLTRAPECAPECAAIGRMAVEARGAVLRLRLEVDAAAPTAVPLPGKLGRWSPSDVRVDGAPATGLIRLDDGLLWVAVAAGLHQVSLEGALPEKGSVELGLPQKPHRVEVESAGWTVAGVHEDGQADDDLELTRARKDDGASAAGSGASLEPGELAPFVTVDRTIHVGVEWQVDTRVTRATPAGSTVVLEVPLLPGESVTTAEVRVAGGKAMVNMGPKVSQVTWRSSLEQRPPIKLVAPRSVAWVEVWHLDVAPLWHAAITGIPAVHTLPGVAVPEWRPWPGEALDIALSRPEGVPGQSVTIDSSRLVVTPGERATDEELFVAIRSSRGGDHTFTLPEGVTLESVTARGAQRDAALPTRQSGRTVTLPLAPGGTYVTMKLRDASGLAAWFATRPVDLGAPSVNATTIVRVPDRRWVLFTYGPRIGPAVLFWSLLLVLAALSIVLGRSTLAPLRAWEWLLLATGLSQASLGAGAVFAAWLFAVGWRARTPPAEVRRWLFNLRQIGLVVMTAVALALLAIGVYHGLLGAPRMQIEGNGATDSELRWFADRAESTLPAAWMISAPLLAYRAAMLGWALWLALRLLGWLKWGWGSFTGGGAWKRKPPPPSAPPPAPPPAEPSTAE